VLIPNEFGQIQYVPHNILQKALLMKRPIVLCGLGFLLLVGLLVIASMFARSEAKKTQLQCTFHLPKTSYMIGEDVVGQFEIENIADTDLCIEHHGSPAYYLDFIVTDPTGNKVKTGRYGDSFFLDLNKRVTTLKPKTKLVWRPEPLLYVDVNKLTPGVYTIWAVFEYQDMICECDAVTIRLVASK
jgi:hypothetical protein